MSIRASPKELFDWLNSNQARYVVLRDVDRVSNQMLSAHAPDDIDLLIDDAWIPQLRAALAKRRGATKVDLYGLEGAHGSDYLGYPHLPLALGRRTLERRRFNGLFYSPNHQEELDALVYHLTYHKNLQSGVHMYDATRSLDTPALTQVRKLARELSLSTLEFSLQGFHDYLEAHGWAVDEDRLIRYLEHDFRYGRKSYFHACLQDRHPGELNLFVIRGIAMKRGFDAALLDKLRAKYQILATKRIDWITRLRTRARMRGGKWRRGGLPHIAVVVYDSAPVASTEEERTAHPFVFNRNQFEKVAWRAWFCEKSGARAKANPIHSTDNEAEALGHLPLFFSAAERTEIMRQLRELRTIVNEGQGHARS